MTITDQGERTVTDFNFLSIYTANFLGFMLAITLFVGNGWRWKRNDRENTLFIFMLVLMVINCISEPLAFSITAKPGYAVRTLLFVTDTWTYAANLMASATWVIFLAYHLTGRINKLHVAFINTIVAAGLLLLFINLFIPVVFRIDAFNNYSRMPTYFGYLVADFVMMLDSLVTYIYIRLKGRRLRFFFFWVYILPIIPGVIIQTKHYGLSLMCPCMVISLAGLMSTLQNELIFKDKLTGIYNRYYLDQLGEEVHNDRTAEYTFVMIDINDFKSINDRFGHLTGDQAIIDTADILTKAVGSAGSAIRYAGDEFVVVLSTHNQIDTDIFIANIRKGFEEFNALDHRPYKLNVSMGHSIANLRETSMDEIMNHIDRLMYEDKTRYYQTHSTMSRRSSDRYSKEEKKDE